MEGSGERNGCDAQGGSSTMIVVWLDIQRKRLQDGARDYREHGSSCLRTR